MEEIKIYIYGASGHGKVILDILYAQRIQISGFLDDDLIKTEFANHPVFQYGAIISKGDKIIIGIGNNFKRMNIANRISNSFLSAIHPSSVVSKDSIIGEGTAIMHLAVIQTGTMIGKHCIINTSSSVDHDCRIGDFVHISPGATICGGVHIGELTWVGAGSTIIQGINIGKNVIIGAGTTVLNDIPDNVMVVGNPGIIKKKINIK